MPLGRKRKYGVFLISGVPLAPNPAWLGAHVHGSLGVSLYCEASRRASAAGLSLARSLAHASSLGSVRT